MPEAAKRCHIKRILRNIHCRRYHAFRCVYLAGVLLLLPQPSLAAHPSLQKLVDATEENGTLIPPPGTYSGPIIVDKPMTIDGQGKVTIDNGGKGTVILLDTDGATIKDLHLTNSGESANDLDSGVQVRGNYNVIKDNIIDDCLFGVDLQESKNNIVRRNTISSKTKFGHQFLQYS